MNRRYSGVLPRLAGTNRVLFEVRAEGESNAGQWGLIGGGAEAHDADAKATMDREWREETGTDPDAVGFGLVGTLALTGSRGDQLDYSVFSGTVTDVKDFNLTEAGGVVAIDAAELLAGMHDDKLSKVAHAVVTHPDVQAMLAGALGE